MVTGTMAQRSGTRDEPIQLPFVSDTQISVDGLLQRFESIIKGRAGHHNVQVDTLGGVLAATIRKCYATKHEALGNEGLALLFMLHVSVFSYGRHKKRPPSSELIIHLNCTTSKSGFQVVELNQGPHMH